MTYPRQSGHLAGSATSEAAAQYVDESGIADSQLQEVEQRVHACRYHGATADEIRLMLALHWPGLHNAIVSARLARLVNIGKIIKTARQKKASTGRQQTVYVHADFADMEQAAPLQSAQKKADFLKEIDPVLRAICSVLDEGKTARLEPDGPFHKKLKERFT